MATRALTVFCRTCNLETGHLQKVPNHVLHLILALLTAGFWLLVWFLVALSKEPAACGRCGTARKV